MKKLKIYLDNCCFNRPYDDQSNDRSRLEAEAVIIIIKNSIAKKNVELIGSEILLFEAEKCPDLIRRIKVQGLINNLSFIIKINENIKKRAKEIIEIGFKTIDALHIACA